MTGEAERALLGSNLLKNSRLETHSDARELIGTGRFPLLGGCQATDLRKHRGRSPDPSKTHPDHGAMVAGLAGGNFVT